MPSLSGLADYLHFSQRSRAGLTYSARLAGYFPRAADNLAKTRSQVLTYCAKIWRPSDSAPRGLKPTTKITCFLAQLKLRPFKGSEVTRVCEVKSCSSQKAAAPAYGML